MKLFCQQLRFATPPFLSSGSTCAFSALMVSLYPSAAGRLAPLSAARFPPQSASLTAPLALSRFLRRGAVPACKNRSAAPGCSTLFLLRASQRTRKKQTAAPAPLRLFRPQGAPQLRSHSQLPVSSTGRGRCSCPRTRGRWPEGPEGETGGPRCPRHKDHVLHAFHVFSAPWERAKKGPKHVNPWHLKKHVNHTNQDKPGSASTIPTKSRFPRIPTKARFQRFPRFPRNAPGAISCKPLPRVYLKTHPRCSILPKSTICCVAFACIPQRSAALMRLASGAFWRMSQHV